MSDKIEGFLVVGTNEKGEVVVNHPDLKPDENGVGHIVFSVNQAEHFAHLLLSKAREAEREHRSRLWQEQVKNAPPVDRTQRQLSGGKPETDDHREINPDTGQQKGYIVLTPQERAKGFVRRVRRTYKHSKCGSTTTCSQDIAETYARDPSFYGGTFCCTCRAHFPLTEFHWIDDGEQVGT
jgi:hypothetical protein